MSFSKRLFLLLGGTVLLVLGACSRTPVKTDYPRAEWGPARVILMHTPGQELFNVIDKDLCTMVSSRLEAKPGDPEYVTCDIWAREPGTKAYSLTESDLSFVDYLKDNGFQIIPIDYDDEMHYANNYLTIAPRHIMAVGGQSETLQQRFRDAGVRVEWIPLESLIDGYGAAHCMTQVLQREVADW